MNTGFRSVVMALIIVLALASASLAADIQLGPAAGPGHQASICPGTSQIFTVSASGSNLTYQWMKGTEPATGDGATTASYTAVEAGAYTCVVTGDCGAATSEVGTVVVLETTVIN